MTAGVAYADGIATEIAGEGWAQQGPAPTVPLVECAPGGGFGILDALLEPLYALVREVTADPAAIYQASIVWDTACGEIQTSSDSLLALSRSVAAEQSGRFIDRLVETINEVATELHSLAHWTKASSQALQVVMRMLQILHALACEALRILADTASLVGELLWGSWPWEWDKKAQAIEEFAADVERFVTELKSIFDRTLQCFRDLARLVLDLYRAVVDRHSELETWLGGMISRIPPNAPPEPAPGTRYGSSGDVYNPPRQPFDGSSLGFSEDYERGYHHTYDLGYTDMTDEEIFALFRENFGHVFVPSRVADNTQLNAELEGVGQEVDTSLFGLELPGITSGGIRVREVTSNGFAVEATEGHPEYPGEVLFQITRTDDGRASFEVAAGYNETILDKHDPIGLEEANPYFAFITDKTVWSDMAYRIEDMASYGMP